MRQPFLLGAFVYVALVAGRMSDNNGLKTTKEGVPFEVRPQRVKGYEIATVNPLVRAKRVTNDPEDITFWANRGRRGDARQEEVRDFDYVDAVPEWINSNREGAEDISGDKGKRVSDDSSNDSGKVNKECPAGCNNRSRREEIGVGEPFWGTRGRRNEDTNIFWGNRGKKSDQGPFWGNRGKKESDYRDKKNPDEAPFWGNRGKRDEGPFWGNRGRRANENDDFNPFWGNRGKKSNSDPFWGNRGRRNDPFWGNRGKKDEIEPFWGNRGKKDEMEPFWGNRGKKDEMEPFWGNRGKKDEMEPFWGNRGKKDDLEPFWGNRGKKDELEPFWGNRGKKDELEPFWGNRGKKDELEPFWGNRGKKDELEPFWGNRGKKDDLEPFWGNRGKKDDLEPFWGNRGKKDDLEPFWGNRGKKDELEPFWGNRGKKSVMNSDLHTNPHFLELVDKSKCESKYFNNMLDRKIGYASPGHYKMFSNKYGKIADPREGNDSKIPINRETLEPSDNILIYAEELNGVPRKIIK